MGNKMVGRRFKECREKAGFTQAELSGKAGCTEQYISAIERGINFPAYNRLVRILNILGVSADAVFCDVLDHAAGQRPRSFPLWPQDSPSVTSGRYWTWWSFW